MSRLFRCWRSFCKTLELAGYETEDIYTAWYDFFEKHPGFYL